MHSTANVLFDAMENGKPTYIKLLTINTKEHPVTKSIDHLYINVYGIMGEDPS